MLLLDTESLAKWPFHGIAVHRLGYFDVKKICLLFEMSKLDTCQFRMTEQLLSLCLICFQGRLREIPLQSQCLLVACLAGGLGQIRAK